MIRYRIWHEAHKTFFVLKILWQADRCSVQRSSPVSSRRLGSQASTTGFQCLNLIGNLGHFCFSVMWVFGILCFCCTLLPIAVNISKHVSCRWYELFNEHPSSGMWLWWGITKNPEIRFGQEPDVMGSYCLEISILGFSLTNMLPDIIAPHNVYNFILDYYFGGGYGCLLLK